MLTLLAGYGDIGRFNKKLICQDVLQDDIEPPPKIVVFLIANCSIVLFLVLILLKIVN